VDVGQSEISTDVTVGQCFVIPSQQGQQRGMEVVHVNLLESSALCWKTPSSGASRPILDIRSETAPQLIVRIDQDFDLRRI
jgi:hypothetical protein